jgi:hypothetical protein
LISIWGSMSSIPRISSNRLGGSAHCSSLDLILLYL